MNRHVGLGAVLLVLVGCAVSAEDGDEVGTSQQAIGGGSSIRVEGVETNLRTKTVFSFMDNPWIGTTEAVLRDVPTQWNGMMPQEIHADTSINGWVNANSDFVMLLSGGEANGGPEVSRAGAVNDTIPLWPGTTGQWVALRTATSVAFAGRGVRLGYKPMAMQAFVEEPGGSRKPFSTKVEIALSPRISLVPIQVALMVGFTEEQEDSDLPAQLALWDNMPDYSVWRKTDGKFGELTTIRRIADYYLEPMNIPGSSYDGKPIIHQVIPPDAALQSCGVQFRMVNFYKVQTMPRNVRPVRSVREDARTYPNNTPDTQPCEENIADARKHPSFIPGVPLVVFMARVGFRDSHIRGLARTSTQSTCVSMKNHDLPTMVSHELGHLAGLADCDGDAPECMLMHSIGGGDLDPSPRECSALKKWGERHSEFFARPASRL